MPLTKKVVKTALLEAINENGLYVVFERNDQFNLIPNGDESRIISTRLIISKEIDFNVHGSHNRDDLAGIGVFRFSLPTGTSKPDYFILAMENKVTARPEFIIVKYTELVDRLKKNNQLIKNKAEIWLWLMPDRCVYDSTNISLEGEWYWVSKGFGGRMSDGTEWDYTRNLNDWNGICI
jgi:hypothetical protein